MHLTYADIKEEFDYSLGYVRQDIRWLQLHNSSLNYTVALLIGCGCEMLAAAQGDKKRRGRNVLAELLPAGDWRLLADRLYTALRDGLAHGFDTKHLSVDGKVIQIYASWNHPVVIEMMCSAGGVVGVKVGVQALANALCAKIDEFEKLLQQDEGARQHFREASQHQRLAMLNQNEVEAWRRLVKAAGC
jgi:hypothetical protein